MEDQKKVMEESITIKEEIDLELAEIDQSIEDNIDPRTMSPIVLEDLDSPESRKILEERVKLINQRNDSRSISPIIIRELADSPGWQEIEKEMELLRRHVPNTNNK